MSKGLLGELLAVWPWLPIIPLDFFSYDVLVLLLSLLLLLIMIMLYESLLYQIKNI